MDVSLTFRLEKRDHSSNCTKVSFHLIVIYRVPNCMSVFHDKFIEQCFVLIFMGEYQTNKFKCSKNLVR